GDPPYQIDVAHRRVRQHLGHRRFKQDGALMKNGDLAGDDLHALHVVLNHDERGRAVDLLDDGGGALGLLVGHSGGRLVEQDDLRFARQNDGELDQLTLAVSECADDAAREFANAYADEHFVDDAFDLQAGLAASGSRQTHVLAHVETAEHIGDLSLDADAQPGDFM